MILPVFLSGGVNAGRLTIRQLAEIGSLNTARLFNLYPRKGTLCQVPTATSSSSTSTRNGRSTQMTVSRSDFSVYEGRTFRGRVTDVGVRGTVQSATAS